MDSRTISKAFPSSAMQQGFRILFLSVGLFFLLLYSLNVQAQLYIDGVLFLENGSSFIYADDDVVNASGGTIDNNGTLHVTGDFGNSGTPLVAGTAKLVGGAQSVTGTTTFNDLDVENGSSTTITSGLTTIDGIVSVASASSVNANGNLILISGSSMLHGVGTPGGGGAVTGDVEVQRLGSANPLAFNYWSSPSVSSNVSALGSNLYYYVPTNATDLTELGLRQGWVAASGNMTPGLGYISQNGGTVSITGTMNNGPTGTPLNIDVLKNAGVSNNVGYNLIGNPFPSSLDAASFLTTNSSVIDGVIYLWDDDGSNGLGWDASQDYVTWNMMGAVSGPNSSTVFDGHISSCQGFFVDKLNTGTDPVEFRNSMRGTQNDAFFRQSDIPKLWVSVTNSQNHYNETLIGFPDDATEGIDWGYDARKLKGHTNIALYSYVQDDKYAIQGLPHPQSEDRVVPLGLDAGIAGEHTFRLKTIELLEEAVVIYLEDRELNIFQNLRIDDTYVFTSETSNEINRFFLHFTPPLSISTTEQGCDGNDGVINLHQYGSQVWEFQLKDDSGALVAQGDELNGELTLSGLDAGIYTLLLTGSDGYEVSHIITVEGQELVTAAYTVDATVVYVDEDIQFSDQSSGANQLNWDFGDGSFSSEVSPVHSYAAAGVYTVHLEATNDDCSSVALQDITVNDLVTGIVDHQDDLIGIYGNGSDIVLNILTPFQGPANFEIWTPTGQLVYTKKIRLDGQEQRVIKINGISAGYYLINIESSEFQTTKPLILGIR